MENKKLIPLSDFVLYQLEIKQSSSEFKEVVRDYTLFLKQPLKLEMFFPCEEGNILRKPADDDYSFYTHKNQSVQEEYQEALEKVLFEDAVVIDKSPYKSTKRILIDIKERMRIYTELRYHDGSCDITNYLNVGNLTIEHLVNWNLTLTPSALKKI